MKSLSEVDLQEWELLPDEGYLEIQDDDGGKKIYSRKYPNSEKSGSCSVFQMNYFDIRPPKSNPYQSIDKTSQIILNVPIVLEQAAQSTLEDRRTTHDEHEQPLVKEETKAAPTDDELESKVMGSGQDKTAGSSDQDLVSQVFFKKMKEGEFVDMKVESPKSNNGKGLFFQPPIQYDKEGDPKSGVPETTAMNMNVKKKKKKVEFEEDGGGPNVWKWSLSGIGAICSFGVAAAATVCVIIFSSGHQNQKLRFQIYSSSSNNNNNKMLQPLAIVAAARGVSGASGIPIARAHITVGGTAPSI